jgi:hypothetical protein
MSKICGERVEMNGGGYFPKISYFEVSIDMNG